MAVVDFLDVVEDLVLSALAVVKALLAGLMRSLAGSVDTIRRLGSIRIPVLSSLLEPFLGHPLTFLELATFVAAIPITLLYRVVDGHWPGDTAALDQASASARDRRIGGLLAGIAWPVAGWVTATLDTTTIIAGQDPTSISGPLSVGLKAVGGLLFLGGLGNTVYQAGRDGDGYGDLQWVTWSCGLGSLLLTLSTAAAGPDGRTGVICNSVLALFLAAMIVTAYVLSKPEKRNVLQFVPNLLLTVPTIVNPVKLLPATSLVPFLAPMANYAFRVAAGALFLSDALIHWHS
jgi:hypothetical protein